MTISNLFTEYPVHPTNTPAVVRCRKLGPDESTALGGVAVEFFGEDSTFLGAPVRFFVVDNRVRVELAEVSGAHFHIVGSDPTGVPDVG
jgi:hypothetical protein